MTPLLLDETAFIGPMLAVFGLFWILVYIIILINVVRYRKGITRTLMLAALGVFTLVVVSYFLLILPPG